MFVGVVRDCCWKINFGFSFLGAAWKWSLKLGLTSNQAEPSCDLFKDRWKQTKYVTVRSIDPANTSEKSCHVTVEVKETQRLCWQVMLKD